MRPVLVLAAALAAIAPAFASDAPRPEPRPDLRPDLHRASRPEPRPPAVEAAAGDAHACIAEAVYYEARGTDDASRAAVAHVVLNRAGHPDFPDTPCAVVAEGCQFSYRCDGRPERLADPEDRAAARRTAAEALAGESEDPTGGALFFHAARIEAAWHATRDRTGRVGPHVFYR